MRPNSIAAFFSHVPFNFNILYIFFCFEIVVNINQFFSSFSSFICSELQNVHTEISFYKIHAICIKLTHYDIDSLNGTIYIYGYDNVTHSIQCNGPLLVPDPTDEANFLSDDAFCSYTNLSSYRVVDYLDFGMRNGSLDNLRERNDTAAMSLSTIVIADYYVINVFSLCCTIYYLLNLSHIRV